jgi:hypothetical protein
MWSIVTNTALRFMAICSAFDGLFSGEFGLCFFDSSSLRFLHRTKNTATWKRINKERAVPIHTILSTDDAGDPPSSRATGDPPSSGATLLGDADASATNLFMQRNGRRKLQFAARVNMYTTSKLAQSPELGLGASCGNKMGFARFPDVHH